MTKTASLVVWIVLAQLLSACTHQSLLGASESTLQVAPKVTLAGSLTEQAPQLIKANNAVVIDLRHPDEGIEKEAQQMQSQDTPYFNIPVNPATFSQTTISELDKLLSTYSERPIIVHCQSGNRAGLVWAALLKERGMSSAEATAAVSGIVTKAPVREAIQSYQVE